MKSKLLQSIDISKDSSEQQEFIQDLKAFFNADHEVIKHIIETFPIILNASTRADKKKIASEFKEKFDIDSSKLSSLASVMNLIYDALSHPDIPEDEISLWYDDLVELKIIEKPKSEYDKLVKLIYNNSKNAEITKKTNKAAHNIFPRLTNIEATVDLRPVFDNEFKPGESLDSYSPKLINFAPVVSIKLNLSDNIQPIFFQLDENRFKTLLTALQSKEKDLIELKERYTKTTIKI